MLVINNKNYKNEIIKYSYGIQNKNKLKITVLDISIAFIDNNIRKKYFFESVIDVKKLIEMNIGDNYYQHGITDFLYFENDVCLTYDPLIEDPYILIDSFEDIDIMTKKVDTKKFIFNIKISKYDLLFQMEILINELNYSL